jgi:transcriptional regulator with XRE-family HTH domain
MGDTESPAKADGGGIATTEVLLKGHGEIVESTHKQRKAKCAKSAGVGPQGMCERRAMPKKHPIRPHLRAWRLHFDKSLEWVADQIGISHSTVQRYEVGKAGVDDATFTAIAKVYWITEAELSAPVSEAEHARALHKLLSTVKGLDVESLTILVGFAQRMRPK